MTVTRLLAAFAAVALATTAGADDKPAKKKPADAKSYDESATAFKAGDRVTRAVTKYIPQTVQRQVQVGDKIQVVTETVLVPVVTTEAVVVPARKWTLGAGGWHDKDGFNIDKITADGPLSNIKVKDGEKEITKTLAAGDVITKLGGAPVANELDLYLAVQAADAGKLTIDVTTADGKSYAGTIVAAKAK